MKTSMKVVALVAIVSLLSLALFAQQKPPQKPDREEQIEKAHEGLLGRQPYKAQEESGFTDAMATALPASMGTAEIPHNNFIDDYIFGRIERDAIPHSGLSNDFEFVRRVYLDATGLLPPVEVVREFVASESPDKRDRLIDSLVGTAEFAEQWAWFWGDLFRLTGPTGKGKNAFHYWNKEWLRVDRPYTDVVTGLLTGVAKSHSTIPQLGVLARSYSGTNQLPTTPDDYAQLNRLDSIDDMNVDVTRLFLGINISCISCHDGAGHLEPINLYLSRRTRQEFFRQAAFLGNIRMIAAWDERSKNNSGSDMVFDEMADGYDTGYDAPWITASITKYPRYGGRYQPAFVLTGEEPRADADPREEFARMITTHRQFRRALVNLVWGRLMTLAFVEPYDSFDLDRLDPDDPPPAPWTIQPTYPELLEALAADFGANDHSVQHVIRTIMKSSAYQLSSQFSGDWRDAYAPYYARKLIRVLSGPEVIDSIAQATGRPGNFTFSGMPVTRVKQMASPGDVGRRSMEGAMITNIMQSFFQSNRSTPPPIGNRASTLQALLLMDSAVVNDRVLASDGSRVQRLVESEKTDVEIVDELFLASLGRFPTPAEREVALHHMESDRTRGAENLQWALLNGVEFILNH